MQESKTVNAEVDLRDAINAFYETNSTMKEYKSSCEALNKTIKALMHELDVNEFETDSCIAKISERHTDDFNEEKLIELFKEKGLTDCINTIETVNYDKLADTIYKLQADGDDESNELLTSINKFRTDKVTESLKVTKKKGVNDEK